MRLNSDSIKEVFAKRRVSVGDFRISAEEMISINEVLNARRLSEGKNNNASGFVLIENLFTYFFFANNLRFSFSGGA